MPATDPVREFPPRKLLGICCCVAVAALLIATLWPFEFFPSNKVSWLPDGDGLRFDGAGMALSSAPLQATTAVGGDSASLEILVRPQSFSSHGAIVSFYTAGTRSEFAFGQYGGGLTVSRHFLNAQDDARWPEILVDHVFEPGKLVVLTVTSDANGTVVYRDGGEPRGFPGFKVLPSDLTGQIVLGTSALLSEPYSGEIRGLALYSKMLTPAEVLRNFNDWKAGSERALDSAAFKSVIGQASVEQKLFARYDFGEKAGTEVHSPVSSAPDLEIPRLYVIPHKPFMESPADEFVFKWDYIRGVLENIAGFAPLGFVLCTYWRYTRRPRQAVLWATLVGGSLSFFIEVVQFYVPPRGSGFTDVITNSLGTLLGAMLARPSLVEAILGRIEASSGPRERA